MMLLKIEGIQNSIDYIEQHLADELDIEEIAGMAAFLPSITSASSAPSAE